MYVCCVCVSVLTKTVGPFFRPSHLCKYRHRKPSRTPAKLLKTYMKDNGNIYFVVI